MREKPARAPGQATWGGDPDTLTHWIKQSFMAMRREIDAALASSGMTLAQWRALGVLRKTPGATHSDLVRELEIEAPSVTSLIDGMERKGWVRRERSTRDARVKQLFLTQRGRRVIQEAASVMAPVEEHMAAALSPGEGATLKRLLAKLVERLR